jgi:hypothetical protein
MTLWWLSSPLMVVQVSCSVSCGTEAFQRAQNAAVPVAPVARPSAHVGPGKSAARACRDELDSWQRARAQQSERRDAADQ